MTQAHINVGLLRDRLVDLLHPDQRGLMRNVKLSDYVHAYSHLPGKFNPQSIDVHDCVGIVVRGLIGVKHKYEGQDSITHFYQQGDLFLSAEIDEVYNRQGSYWQFYKKTEMILLPLKSSVWKRDQPQLASALHVQASLMAAFTYQKYINNLGLDRKLFSICWLRSNKSYLGVVPRADIAIFLDISRSSLKSFIKIAFNDE